MKLTLIDWMFRTGSVALAFAVSLTARAADSTPAQAASPCTYVGRVMDAEHVGFDTNRVAEIAAYDASGKKVAETKTFYKPNAKRNYALQIPMASKAVDGTLTTNQTISIEVTDSYGDVWTGIVVGQDAKLGVPGTVKEVDIVLAQCTNEYGIDDKLLEDLYYWWCESDYYVAGETFDPRKDYDGDGMSTIGEALSGTNPFDPNDCLAILSFQRGGLDGVGKDVLSFVCYPGRSYTLEVTESLSNPEWRPKAFYLNESGTPVNYISVPAGATSEETPTIYLLPEPGKNAFFRIKAD